MPAVRLSAASFLPVACLVLSFGLVFGATPTRVGDGGEYWAVATQLASWRLPSMTEADLARLEGEARRIGHGFEVPPLRFAELVSADGRQDFPHFWLYPLINVPGIWLTSLTGLHPNWAFTLTNWALLAFAFVVVARQVSIAWATLVLAGPLMWWFDKAHGDVFAVSLLAAAWALWHRAPWWTLGLLALIAAQNPVLMPVWGVVAVVALTRTYPSPRATLHMRLGLAAGALILAAPLAYYMTRLQVWSPLLGYTRPGFPSLRTAASLLLDANVGFAPSLPFFCAAAAVAVACVWLWRRATPPAWRDWLLLAAAAVLLLAGGAQSVNLNHGATPGINRWTLWLMPLVLLVVPRRRAVAGSEDPALQKKCVGSAPQEGCVEPARQEECVGSAPQEGYVEPARQGQCVEPARQIAARPGHRLLEHVLVALAVFNTAWGVWYFRPSLPETYRAPTGLAAFLWTHAPGWYSPAPEIFAERVTRREPPPLPAAWEGCTKILVVDGQWPAPCLPPAELPAACAGADRLCYASGSQPGVADGAITSFVPLGAATFHYLPNAQRWPQQARFTAALRRRIAGGGAGGTRLVPQRASTSALRATQGVGWTTIWANGSTIAIYLDTMTSDATLFLRVDADHLGHLVDLDTDRAVASIEVPRSGERPSAVTPGQPLRHALLWLERR